MTPRHAWCTASHSDTVKSTRTDLAALGAHLNACPQVHRHWLALQGVARLTHGFMVTRFVTTLVALAVMFGLGYWLL